MKINHSSLPSLSWIFIGKPLIPRVRGKSWSSGRLFHRRKRHGKIGISFARKVILQGPRDDTSTEDTELGKEDAEEEDDLSKREEEDRGVQREGKPKRKVIKPNYLKDYV